MPADTMSRVAELSFFIGKGGVGKTTLASAFALHTATKNKKRPALLISTDPAHSLADIFQTRFGDSPRAISFASKKRLWVWQVNAQREFGKFLDRYRESIFSIIESGTIFSRKEIEPLLDSTLPGMAEMAALLAIHNALESEKYGAIVVDTAPFGHTLRLFEMPQHFSRFLDFLDLAASRDQVLAQTFGGSRSISQPFIAEWRKIVDRIQSALASSSSRLVLVTTPEHFALNESVRVRDQLAQDAQLRVSDVILNRAIVGQTGCARCGESVRRTRIATTFIKRNFPGSSLKIAQSSGAPILGPTQLVRFAEHVFARKRPQLGSPPARKQANLEFKRVDWPDLQTSLSFSIGKGGVGKTTVSAALAVHQRTSDRKNAIAICSTDPAPSLDDIFQADVSDYAAPVLGDSQLLASELDSVSEYRRWADGVHQKISQAMSSNVKGIHVDLSFDRQVISALLDIVPPGVDELFAIFRILDLLNVPGQRVIIDMAPTGHALELLRMPERILHWSRLLLKSLAAHRTLPLARDVAVEIATISQRVRELAKILRDRKRSQVWPVMLAEPLPDRETARLLDAMHELGAEAAAIFVNRVIFKEDAGGCPRCTLARSWQMQTLQGIATRLAVAGLTIYIIRDRPHEIAGKKALKDFTQELWQLA
jgi:arsenite/tail-anchored protein-transporting ATPase